MGNNNGIDPIVRRYITHDPYALTFFTAPDGNEATLIIDVRDVHTTGDFLDLRRQVVLTLSPNGCSTRCEFITDAKPDEDCKTPEEAELNRDIVLKGPEIARVALRSLDEFPGRGHEGVVLEGDGLNYGYYRKRIPPFQEDPIPWRRCRFSDESAAEFRVWQERTGQDMSHFNATCNALGAELTDGFDPSLLLSTSLVVEFNDINRDDRDPEVILSNRTEQLPLQARR